MGGDGTDGEGRGREGVPPNLLSIPPEAGGTRINTASWVVSYGGKTIPRWRTAAILKIDISPCLSVKSSDFHDVIKK